MATWQERERLTQDGYTIANRLLAKKLKATRKKLQKTGLTATMTRRILQQVIYKAIGA